MTQHRHGAIDGVDLTAFRAGRTYEVDSTLATYLVVCGCAEPASHDGPALVVQCDETLMTVPATPWPDILAEVADETLDGAEDPDPTS